MADQPGRVLRTVQNTVTQVFPVVKSGCMDGPQAKRPRTDGSGGAAATFPEDALVTSLLEGGASQRGQARPSTDFSDFHCQRKERELGGHQGPSCGSQQDGLHTFLDIAQTKAVATDRLSDAQQVSLQQGINLCFGPRAGGNATRPNDAAATAAGLSMLGAAVSTAAPAPAVEVTAQTVPYDWSLKRSMRLASTQPLISPQVLACLPGASVLRCQSSAQQDAPPEDKLGLALGSWQHPEQQLDGHTLAALASASSAAATAPSSMGGAGPSGRPAGPLHQRMVAWQSALRSVYMATRAGRCTSFYVVVTGRHPYVALFCAAGVRGSSVRHAVVSQSSRALRSRMAALGLSYSMPLAGPGAVGAQEDRGDDAEQAAGPSMAAAGVRDNSVRSVLLFSGDREVHGLFDFVMAEALGAAAGAASGAAELAADVPVILAPVPFEGSTLKLPQIKVMSQQLPGAAAAGSTRHLLQLSGLMPPWVLHRLSHYFWSRAQPDFALQAEVDLSSLALNCEVPAATTATAGGAAGKQHQGARDGGKVGALAGGCGAAGMPDMAEGCGVLSARELGVARVLDPVLGRRVVKGVAATGEGFVLHLSS